MNIVFAKKIRKLTSVVLICSIISLVFLYVFPFVTISDSTNSGNMIYLNHQAMKTSDNSKVLSLSKILDIIEIYIWILVVFCILVNIGIVTHFFNRYSIYGNIVLLISILIVIFNALMIVGYWNYLNSFNENDIVSGASLVRSIPINYVHICFALALFSLVFSLIYIATLTPYLIKEFKAHFKQRKQGGIKEDLTAEQKIKKSMFKDDEKKNIIKDELDDSDFLSEKPDVTLKEPSKWRQKTQITENTAATLDEKVFETGEKKPEIIDEVKKEISVRCPQCKQIFSVETSEEGTKIVCPKCGKSGIIKK